MQTRNQFPLKSFLAGGLLLLAGVIARGQSDTQALPSSEVSENSVPAISLNLLATLESLSKAFSSEQQIINAQTEGWCLQHAGRLALQLHRGQTLAALQDLLPMDYITDVEIPGDASPTLEAYLVSQAELMNARAQIHNELIEAWGETMTIDQDRKLIETEVETFNAQNAGALAQQVQWAKELSEISAREPMEDFSPAPIPADASPNLKAFLTLKNALFQEQIAVHNQYCAGTPAQLQAAMEAWEAANVARTQRLSQLATKLSQETPAENQP